MPSTDKRENTKILMSGSHRKNWMTSEMYIQLKAALKEGKDVLFYSNGGSEFLTLARLEEIAAKAMR